MQFSKDEEKPIGFDEYYLITKNVHVFCLSMLLELYYFIKIIIIAKLCGILMNIYL